MRQHMRVNWPIYAVIALWIGGMILIGLKNGWT